MIADEVFMRRALELALLGTGRVSPNPRVGCVIVCDENIIGEGWHQLYGGPHAEVNAVASVKDQSLLKRSTLYVTLEPCSHTGKTPPCADLIVRHQFKSVIISNTDPNPLVNGKGIRKLTDAGIRVVTGVCEQEGRELNKSFFTSIEKGRPRIILKWAQSSDGFLAGKNSASPWISNPYSRQLVHRWRSEEDAVLVGTQTALLDNPRLNVRDWSGRDPLRVVIDRNLRLPPGLNLWTGPQKTICYNSKKNEINDTVEFVSVPGQNFLPSMLEDLLRRRVHSVIVEGGAVTLGLFLEAGLWDEARVFCSNDSLGAGISAPVVMGRLGESCSVFSDELKIFYNG